MGARPAWHNKMAAIFRQTWTFDVGVDLIIQEDLKTFSSCEMQVQGAQPQKFLLKFMRNTERIGFRVKSLSERLDFMMEVCILGDERAVVKSSGWVDVSGPPRYFYLCSESVFKAVCHGRKTVEFFCKVWLPGGRLRPGLKPKVCKFEDRATCRARLVHDLAKAASPDLPFFSDVTLICQDRSFAGHKVLLAARSDVFAAMFSHEAMAEASTGSVEITDMKSDTLEQMLKFIYTDEFEGQVPLESACKLLAAADKYNIQPMAAVCELLISSEVDIGTVVLALTAAYLHGSHSLKNYLIKFAKDNMLKLSLTSEWSEVLKAKQGVFQEISRGLLESYISDAKKVEAGK